MKLNRHAFVIVTAVVSHLAGGILRADASGRTGVSALSPVPIAQVRIDDGFWSPKYDVWRRVTMGDCLDKFEHDGTLDNFDAIARGELTAEHRALPWFDGLLYEMIRASADFMAGQPDAALKARLDGYIDRIAAAAARDADGYLNTYTQLKEPTHRWGANGGNDRWQHDLYNVGCMTEAGVHYYRATGETKLLAVAVRAVNGMCKVMGPPPRANLIPGHALPEQALVELAELLKSDPALAEKVGVPTHADDYIALAKFWLDARGHHDGRTDFGAYNQDAVPALQQETIEGHAVRAPLFASGMVAVGMATGEAQYIDVAQRLWHNMVERRMYLTGGVGSFANDEKFGPDYVLPNDGYLETCAAVASCFFSEHLHEADGDAATVDEIERALYNNALAGVGIDGKSYFYDNPLQADPKRQRWAWHPCPCCPPMFLKLMGAMPGYIYSTDAQGALYVNLFVGSTASTKIGGTDVRVAQTTRYPWDGEVKLTLEPTQAKTFDLYVRVPGWTHGGPSNGGLYTRTPAAAADAFQVSINGSPVDAPTIARGYAKFTRAWKAGDTIELHMAMPIQRVTANEQVEADRGRVALMRGPLVYCFESIDNGVALNDLLLPDDAPMSAETRPELLGGVTILHADAHRAPTDATADATVSVTAIPYFANANRGPVEMRTWIPRSASAAKPATSAAATAPTTKPTWMP